MRNLQPKTFVANTPEEIDRKVVEFGKEHVIAFTTPVPMADSTFQRLVLYEPTAEEEVTQGPSAAAVKQQVEADKPEEWADCLQCYRPWKLSHYPACRCGNSDRTKTVKRSP